MASWFRLDKATEPMNLVRKWLHLWWTAGWWLSKDRTMISNEIQSVYETKINLSVKWSSSTGWTPFQTLFRHQGHKANMCTWSSASSSLSQPLIHILQRHSALLLLFASLYPLWVPQAGHKVIPSAVCACQNLYLSQPSLALPFSP
jgi:hypothetical protein